jgi:predicted Ser/Thr protein kinase
MTGGGASAATRDARAISGESGFRRSEIDFASSRVLSRGGWGNPDVYLVETARGPIVVKDFGARSRPIRALIGPWLIRREMAAYRRLAGMVAVPRLLGPVGRRAFALEYRPGTLLSRALRGRLPADFLTELEAAVVEMHRRGVVHLDLRHRSNVLAGDDGRPVLIDFASALRFDPATRWGRLAVLGLGWLDLRALAKWRARLGE